MTDSQQNERHDRVSEAISRWHEAPEGECEEPLPDYLGWTFAEYATYVQTNTLPPEREGAL